MRNNKAKSPRWTWAFFRFIAVTIMSGMFLVQLLVSQLFSHRMLRSKSAFFNEIFITVPSEYYMLTK
ncbi:hypothetical protein B9G55_22340 [Saccharibacillus sp. O16]|nr:hypothetical protein B9G55_22340 [Saccharibacillus sp. O16]